MVVTRQALHLIGLVADDALMHHPDIPPRKTVAEHLLAPVGEILRRAVSQLVCVGGQLAEVRRADYQIVGVDHPDVVRVPLRERESLGAVMAEVLPRALMQLAGDPEPGHVGADDVLGAVLGAGVDDAP